MVNVARKRATYAEYMAFTDTSEIKHEYIAGEIVAMAGGTIAHGRLIAELTGLVREALKGRPCVVLPAEVRVRIRAADRATYPDLHVVCTAVEADPDDTNAVVNPTVIVEVLSDSIADADRGDKFAAYRRLSSLREYVLVSVFVRISDAWPQSGQIPDSVEHDLAGLALGPALALRPPDEVAMCSLALDSLRAPTQVCLGMSSVVSRAASELPDIEDRLVEPETRYEMLDGELAYVSPADRLHGRRHAKIIALLEAYAAPGFEVGCDLLTRTSQVDDVAPDASVYPEAPDPRTGGRQLEQLAFEVVSTESLGHAGRKTAKLTARGVRRVFAIDIERSRVLEWSAALATWQALDPRGHIEDPALALPLPIEAMLDAARADDKLAHALVARHNPVIEAVRAEDRAASKAEGVQEGLRRGKAEAVLAVLAARKVGVGDAERVRILGERDPAQLDRWLAEAAICAEVAELFTTVDRR